MLMCRLYPYPIYIILKYDNHYLIGSIADQQPMLVAYDPLP